MANTWTLPSFEDTNPSKRDVVNQWIVSNIDYKHWKEGFPVCFYRNTSFYLTSLPDFRNWPPDMKAKVFEIIVDVDMKDDLEQSGLINWCRNVRRVVPIRVAKDGNCLLHAVCIAVWGVSDRDLCIRRLLGVALNLDTTHRFHSRWRRQREVQISQVIDRLLDSTSVEGLTQEWKEIGECCAPSTTTPTQSIALPHRFLESIHVYALANILRRPIIILTDPTMRTFSGMSLQDNDMGGIYLPLEWKWDQTCRTPILMGYSQSHFAPLLFADYPSNVMPTPSTNKDLAPLVNCRLEQMPVRFLLPGEEPEVGELLRKYLRIKETVMNVNGDLQSILCAELETSNLPNDLNLVHDFLNDIQQQLSVQNRRQQLQYPVGGLQRHHSHQLGQSQPVREQLQKALPKQYGMGDPALQGLNQSPIRIPPPSFTPRHSFPGQASGSQSPPENLKCVVPSCKFYGDPELNMMCSTCFKNYSRRESRKNLPVAQGAAFRTVPTAPMSMLHQAAEDEPYLTSMMSERCKTGCGFRCSIKTYPYCHECAGKASTEARQRSEHAAVGTLVSLADPNEQTYFQNPGAMGAIPKQQGSFGALMSSSLPLTPSPAPAPHAAAAPISTEGPSTPKNTQKLEISAKPTAAASAAGGLTSPTTPTAHLAGPPLTPPEDTNEELLFGSGQASPEAANNPLALPTSSNMPTSLGQIPEQYLSTASEGQSGSQSHLMVSAVSQGPQGIMTSSTYQQSRDLLTGEEELSSAQPSVVSGSVLLNHIEPNIPDLTQQPPAGQENSWQPLKMGPSFIPEEPQSGEEEARAGQNDEQQNQNGWAPLVTSPTFHPLLPEQPQETSPERGLNQLSSPSGREQTPQASASAAAAAPTNKECTSPNCTEQAFHQELCPKCYVIKDSRLPDQPANRNVDEVKNVSINSKSSSAPCSIGAGARPSLLQVAVGGAPEVASPMGTFQLQPQTNVRATSLTHLPSDIQMPAESKVSHWLSGNRNIGQPHSHNRHHGHHHHKDPKLPKSPPQPQPMGLPENEVSEPLANKDLIASGSGCYSATAYCIGDGCKNVVQKEGELCQSCKDILRAVNRGQGSPSVGSQGPRPWCLTENCRYYGNPETQWYCSHCYGELVNRQIETEAQQQRPSRLGSSSAPGTPQPGMINVPPDFNYLPPHPPERMGPKCKVGGCSMFGDPKQNSMCSKHYNEYLTQFSAGGAGLGAAGGSGGGALYTSAAGASARAPVPSSGPHSAPVATSPRRHHHQQQQQQQQQPRQNSEVQFNFPHASSIMVTQGGATVYAPGRDPFTVTASTKPTQLYRSETGGIYTFPNDEVSVSPPSFPTPESIQGSQGLGALVTGVGGGSGAGAGAGSSHRESSLGETYNRVAGIQAKKCLSPDCSNFGNASNGGWCNSCYKTQRYNEDMLGRMIYGDEETG